MKPNIILITIDSLRADHCGFMGYEKNTTPFLDGFARKAMIFRHAYAPGPTTWFTFPSLFSGTRPISFSGWSKKSYPALNERPNLAKILKQNGYTTMAVHSNPCLAEFFGYRRGFDIFIDMEVGTDERGSIRQKIRRRIKNILTRKAPRLLDRMGKFLVRVGVKPEIKKSDAELINQAVKKVLNEIDLSRPVFLWVHYMDVHHPYVPKEAEFLPPGVSKRQAINFFLKHPVNEKQEKYFRNNKKDLEKLIGFYDSCIKYTDKKLSELFQFLENQNLLKNSLVIITADHGDEFLDHGNLGHNPHKAASHYLYEHNLRVPLLIKSNQGCGVNNNLVNLSWLAPTLMDILGVARDKRMLKRNFFTSQPERLFFETLRGFHPMSEILDLEKYALAVRRGSWKYIKDTYTRKEEIFNLANDPEERYNLINKRPDKIPDIKNMF